MFNRQIISTVLMLLIYLGVFFLYTVQIQPSNEYLMMQPLHFTVLNIVSLISFMLLFLFFFIKKKLKPSTLFINIYILFTITWFSFFYDVSREVDGSSYFVLWLLLVTPVIVLHVLSTPLKIFFSKLLIVKPIIKEQYLEFFLISILLVVTGYILIVHNLSFSFESSYVRRIEGRENISDIWRYLIPACLNAIAPLLAFLAGVNRRYHYFIIALLFAVLGFGLIGTKAPIGYVFILFLLGYITKKGKNTIPLIILSFIALAVLCSLIEYWLFNFSWIADIVIRRAFLVVPQIQMYYIDYFMEYFDFDTLLFGLPKDSTNISFLIGNYYFHNPLTNSNTNTFLYEVGRNGLLGYGFSIIFLSFFFSFLDFWYERYQQNSIIGVSIIYSFLLIEQSYTTAMITSGVLYIFVLTLIASKRLKENQQNDSCH